MNHNKVGESSVVDSLEQSFEGLFWNPARYSHLKEEKLASIESTAKTVAAVARTVSCIALIVFFQNPILANAIAFPLEPIVKIATKCLFGAIAVYSNPVPVAV